MGWLADLFVTEDGKRWYDPQTFFVLLSFQPVWLIEKRVDGYFAKLALSQDDPDFILPEPNVEGFNQEAMLKSSWVGLIGEADLLRLPEYSDEVGQSWKKYLKVCGLSG
jgi:hypothetical protein